MRKHISLLLFLGFMLGGLTAQQQPDFNLALVGQGQVTFPDDIQSQFQSYNDIWGWVSPDGTEYAIMGHGDGTSIFSLADPSNPVLVATVPGALSVWRDIKSYGEFVYVVADQGEDGLLIIDMREAPDNISWRFHKPELLLRTDTTTLKRCHNLYIDGTYVFLAGCQANGGGVLIFDLAQNPQFPTFVATSDTRYAHDVVVNQDLMFTSDLRLGFAVTDISDISAPVTLAMQATTGAFTHNAWPSDDNSFLFTTDERGGAYVESYDISNLDDIVLLDRYKPPATLANNVIPHNVHFHDQYLYISYYTDGLKIVDAHRPDNLVEVASYDTYFVRDGGFHGHWGAYPFLPSGLVLSSDRSTGLYVFRPTLQRASYLEGTITDSLTNLPVKGVQVQFLSDYPSYEESADDGSYSLGLADSGTVTVRYFKEGYGEKIIEVDLSAGETVRKDVPLSPLLTYSVSGIVLSDETGAPLANAPVTVQNRRYHASATTDAQGNFQINSFEGEFVVAAGAWGYIHQAVQREIGADITDIELRLERGYRDDFTFDYGWTLDTNVVTRPNQQWARGTPDPSTYNGEFANPNGDLEDDFGQSCYVTGLEGVLGSNLGDSSLLISPVFDLSSYEDPYLYYHLWFFAAGVNLLDDSLKVFLTNGQEDVLVELLTESASGWRERSEIRIADYLPPTAAMQMKVLAADVGSVHIYEAGLDGFAISEGMSTAIAQDDLPSAVTIIPNPFEDRLIMQLNQTDRYRFHLMDLTGRLIRQGVFHGTSYELSTSDLRPGAYVIRLQGQGGSAAAKKIFKF